jgi:hypothetical protein
MTLDPTETITRVLNAKKERFWAEYEYMRDHEHPKKCWSREKSNRLFMRALELAE